MIKYELDNPFIHKYINQSVAGLMLRYPGTNDEKLRRIVEEDILTKDSEFMNKYNVSERDPFGRDIVGTMYTLLTYLETDKPILTGFGALYQQHQSGIDNVLLKMVQYLLNERKVCKGHKFEHAHDEDKALYNLFDKQQLTFKLLNNSFFGAAGQPQCIFFDPYFPSAIMYTGQIIIMTAMITFEKISGNFYFDTLDDCMLYMERILSQEYKADDFKIDIHSNKQQVFDLLKSKFEGKTFNENRLMIMLSALTDIQLDRIYYKNNFLKFIENTGLKNVLSEIIKFDFLDVNKPSKELSTHLDKFWKWTSEYCMYEFISVNRVEFCHTHTRNTVLTVDTDSNFLYNKPFTNILRGFFPEELKDYKTNMNMKLSAINISMFIFTRLIGAGYDHMGTMLNVDEEHRPVINMKNEFTFDRLMTTPQKKHYAGILLAQEGIILSGSPMKRLDMKGLQLRKSSLNKNIRTYFTDTLLNKILLPEVINLPDIYSDFESKEIAIKTSLLKGELEYTQPGKVNSIDKYVTPFTIQTLRGTLLWNALFPANPIMPPQKINFLKLKPMPYLEFVEAIPEEYRERVIKLYSTTIDKNGKKLSDVPVNIIGIPKNVNELPDFVRPFINIDVMVQDQIKAAMEILKPLEFKSLDILDKSFSTNIINI